MSKNQFTTWEGIVERNMDAGTTKKMYCLAKSKDEAITELERLCKKDYPGTFYLTITDIKPSDD